MIVPRQDVSEVPLQGGYVAKLCPVRAQNDHDQSLVGRALAFTAAQQARIDDGNAFEAQIVAEFVAAHGSGARQISTDSPQIAKSETRAAIQDEIAVILGGWPPDDTAERRTGRPDVLVRHLGGYVPVDIKHHTLTTNGDAALLASSLDRPGIDYAEGVPETTWRRGRLLDDSFQLAHYWRLLEQADLVPGGIGAAGGIVDRARRLWWIDLDVPLWRVWWRDAPVSTLERYDHEFAFRLDVIAHAQARNDDPTLEPKVVAVRIGECGECPWRAVCLPAMEAEDHVSLLARSSWATFVEHRRRGVVTRKAVARLDWTTAWVIHGDHGETRRVDVAAMLDRRSGLEPHSSILELVGRNRVAQRRLSARGITKVGDLDRLDPLTATYWDAHVGWLPGLIDQAIAAVLGGPHRARGIGSVDVPRGDLEIDLDMENIVEGVYLWGTLASAPDTLRSITDLGYRPFVDWEMPLTPEIEARLLADLWTWLTEIRSQVNAAGRSLRIYCYTGVEAAHLRRIAGSDTDVPGLPSPQQVANLLDSQIWVDLHGVFTRQIVTGESASLKVTAPYSGFAWRDDDAGGDVSMVWHGQATAGSDVAARQKARKRLLAYNEDDVRATSALRDWLTREGDRLPSLDTARV